MAGMSPARAVGRQAERRWRHELGQVGVERTEALRDREERHGVADRRVDLGAVPDDPGIGHQPLPVGRVERRDDGRVEAAERGSERLALAQDRRPRQARLERFERQPLEQLGVVVDRPAPLVVVVGDHQRVRVRAVRAGPGAPVAWLDHGPRIARPQGIGASPNNVLRSIGSADGRPALKTERKTSPDTFFVPAEPMRVTLISRPETPVFRRSSAVSVPTRVRESAANQADSWATV